MPRRASPHLTVGLLLFGNAAPVAAQAALRPAPSVLWAAARRDAPGADMRQDTSVTRGEGFAIGATIGGLAAGFLGYRMCVAYSALGDCWGTALWWAVIGGGLGGLIGASAGEEEGRTRGAEGHDHGGVYCRRCRAKL